MAQDAADPASPSLSTAILATRIGTGIAQGLALFALSRLVNGDVPSPWVSAHPKGFGLLVLLATLLPLPVLLGLGHIRGRVLAAWMLAATGLILLLGLHDLRQHGEASMTPASDSLVVSLGAMLFIGQALLTAADAGRRWRPRYADCFEAAWRAGLQLALAGCFVLGFWAIYWVASELFRAIGIDALHRLGGRSGVVLPLTTLLGAIGIHLADAGWRLTRGLRNLLLGLKAWLTPVLAGFVAAFLLTLPFTGLYELEARDDAPGWLIAAAAGLVALVSAVHGDGRDAPHGLLRRAAGLASLLLPALLLLAGWLLLRQVAELGLTEGRVVGLAFLAVLAVNAVAYPIAAARPGSRLLEQANIAAALLALPVLAALNLPLADPARLEARSQTTRLLRGNVSPDKFDFDRLGRLGHDGRQALATLLGHPDPEIARRAGQAARHVEDPAVEYFGTLPEATRLRAVPAGAVLPPGLVEAMRQARPECLDVECLARAVPAVGEGAWLVGPVYDRFWLMQPDGAGWQRAAIFDAPYGCPAQPRSGLLESPPRAQLPPLPDLDLGGVLFRPALLQEDACP